MKHLPSLHFEQSTPALYALPVPQYPFGEQKCSQVPLELRCCPPGMERSSRSVFPALHVLHVPGHLSNKSDLNLMGPF